MELLIEKLVLEFSSNVMAQSDALVRGESTAGNRHAKRYIKAFLSLRSLGDRGRDALVPLMYDARDDVRVLAAAYLLRHRHDAARAVLEELAKPGSRVAFSASETLKRWAEGNWQLDPEDSPT